jgi:hypothetical protein
VSNVRDDQEAQAMVAAPRQPAAPAARPGTLTADTVTSGSSPVPAEGGQPARKPGRHGPRTALAARLAAVSREGWYVAALAVLAAVVAVLVKYLLFPYLSVNNDEALYRLQAQTLASGRLFPVAGNPTASFAPWLAIARHGHYVLKYTPFVPALFALSLLVTGAFGPGLAVIAAAAVVVTYRLGLALFGDRRVAAVAATLFTASPLVVLLDGMLLAYLPTLVLVELAVLGLLRGVDAARAGAADRRGWRDPRGWALAGAGLSAGVAGTVRPYDVLTLLSPLVVWAVVTTRGGRWWLAWRALAGMVPPAALLLAFDAAATGSPFRLPFTYLESEDKMGFGVRRLYPTDIPHHFTFLDGLSSVGLHLLLLGGWACGGVVLLGCAIAAVVRRRTGGAANALGGGALLFLAGYVAFWGAWNAAYLWGGIRFLGPFYVLPVLAVLVQLGARAESGPRRGEVHQPAGAGVVCAGLTGVVLATAIPTNLTLTQHDRDLARIVAALPGRPLVFLSVDPEYVMHPTSQAANPPALDSRVLWAVTAGGAADGAVLAHNPGRTPYLLRIPPLYNKTAGAAAGARLERLEPRTGASVTLDVTIDAAARPTRSARLIVSTDAGDLAYPIDPAHTLHARLVITATGATLEGLTTANGLVAPPTRLHVRRPPGTRDGNRLVGLVLYETPVSANRQQFVDRELAPTVVSHGRVTVLAPTAVVGATPERQPPQIHLLAAS